MTKRKKGEHETAPAPLESEVGAAIPLEPEAVAPPATDDEVVSGSLFTEEAQPEAAPAAQGEVDAAALVDEVAELRARSEEYLDGWQRARAEFANYKKRIEREQEEARGRAAAGALSRVLPVIDDLRLALRDRPDGDEIRSWAEGIELIYRKLQALLEAEGVEEIPAEGAAFDPELHEAVTYEESREHQEGQIIEVIQPGYRLGERVLRPARVRVAR